jgi:hypothetical protein
MKVLVYAASEYGTPWLETVLELLIQHQANHDTIKILKCGTQLHSCRLNVHKNNLNKWIPDYKAIIHETGLHSQLNCINCQERFYYGFKFLNIPSSDIYDLAPFPEEDRILLPAFKSVSELKAFEFEGIDIGSAVASTIISYIDDHEFDINYYQMLVHKKIHMSIQVLRNIEFVIANYKPDRVYIFNGRHAETRPVLRACQRSNTEVVCYEVGSDLTKYRLVYNTLPHDFKHMEREIQEKWQQAGEEKYEIGKRFFENRLKGDFKLEHEKGLQVPDPANTLPEGFNPKKRNIGIFNSSLNEYEAIPGLSIGIFPTAHDALVGIFEHFKNHPDIHFYLRIHPNLGKRNNTQTKQLASLNYPNLTIIPGTSKINTYNLIRAMEKTICYVSATAGESVYLGKPVISIGSSYFQNLDIAYHPKSAKELYDLIESQIAAKKTEGHLMIGYFFMTFGIPFRYYRGESLNKGIFEYEGKIFTVPKKTWYRYVMKQQNRVRRRLSFLFKPHNFFNKLDLAWQKRVLKPFLNQPVTALKGETALE